MKAKYLIATTLLLAATTNCRPAQKGDSDSSNAGADQGSKFESFDLGCQFEDINGQPKADSNMALTGGSCANANQYYPMLLTQFDTNGDGQLTGPELSRSESEYMKAQLLAIDTDNDGLCSLSEIAAWRAKNLKARLAKLTAKYKAACSLLQQDDESCQSLYTRAKEDHLKKIQQEKATKLAADAAAKSAGMDYGTTPSQANDQNCVDCQPVVKVPVKVKVDVNVDVTKKVNYTNFDQDCVLIDNTANGHPYSY